MCCKAAMCNVKQTLGTNAHTKTRVQTHLVALIKCAPTHIGTNQRGITANLSLQAYLHHVSMSDTHTLTHAHSDFPAGEIKLAL